MIGQTAPAATPRTAAPRYSGKAILAFLAGLLSVVVPSPFGIVLAVIAMGLGLAARSDLKADAQLRGTTLSLLGFLIGAGAFVVRILPWVVPHLLKEMDGYVYTHELGGTKHFGLWPLSQAAQTCFGTDRWPAEHPVPQATIEFEVDDVSVAEGELLEKGHVLLHSTRTEPWGQVTARLLSPEGLLVGLVSTPWLK